MFGNYLSAAIGNLARNRLHAAISIAGLAIGFAAAILIALYARDEFSYDRFIPGGQHTYLVAITAKTPRAPAVESLVSEVWTAPLMKLQFPEVADAVRLQKSFSPPLVKLGDYRAAEQHFYWADPGFFRVLPLRAIAGDPASALDQPDGLVITRAMARKYFHRDAPLGAALLVDGHPLRVAAVLEDPPSNTHLDGDFYASSLSAFSAIKQSEKMNGVGDFYLNTLTYIRLKPGARAEGVEQAMPRFFRERMPIEPSVLQAVGAASETGRLVPLADIHLRRADQGEMKPQGNPQVVAAIALVGVLIVIIATINFVTLMTARAGRRALEVGVRKAAGATRGDLIAQFMGEAVVQVLLAMLAAAALAELLLPAVNAFLQRRMSLNYLGDPGLDLGMLAFALVVGLAAGAYPALVLSSFNPSAALKGGVVRAGGSALVRQGLVIAQFSILITLIVMTVTVARQTAFALNEGMRVDKDQTLIAFVAPCTSNFRDEVRALPGVAAAGCSGSSVLAFNSLSDGVRLGDQRQSLEADPIDFGFFDVYGLTPLAGRLFDRTRPEDGLHPDPDAASNLVLNETAARALGFASPAQAVGRTLSWHGAPTASTRPPPARPARVIGVVRDFTFGDVRARIRPTVYYVGPKTALYSTALNIRLKGRDIPQTLAALDRVWAQVGDGRPMIRTFTSQFMMFRYRAALAQGAVIAVCAMLALVIASLGLIALSAFTAEQRTREIGVRKAMGAGAGDIVRLLVWQFTKPVLWANLIAWPVAFMVMSRWLQGFAYHVDLQPGFFLLAAGAAVTIAWLTVSAQAVAAARAKPVDALRYE
ncbi:MAG TPA: ABC transporter permease [Caulobacteraceae bacterium]